MTTRQKCFDLLDNMEIDTEFNGMSLFKAAIEKSMHYPSTILRYMRIWRQNNDDFNIICLDKSKSIYKKVTR